MQPVSTHMIRVPLPSLGPGGPEGFQKQRFWFKLTAVGLNAVAVYIIDLATSLETRGGAATSSSVLRTYVERVGNQDYINCTFRTSVVPRQLFIEGCYESSPIGWVLIKLNTHSRPLDEAECDEYTQRLASYSGDNRSIGVFTSVASTAAAVASTSASASTPASAPASTAQKRTATDASLHADMTSNEGLKAAFNPGAYVRERPAKRAASANCAASAKK